MKRLDGADLKSLGWQHVKDGDFESAEVDWLLESAIADRKLKPREKAELKIVSDRYSDEIDPKDQDRIQAFTEISNVGIRQVLHRDRVKGTSSFLQLQQQVYADDKLTTGEKSSLDTAREVYGDVDSVDFILQKLADGHRFPKNHLEFLSDADLYGYTLEDAPRSVLRSRETLIALLCIRPESVGDIPDRFSADPDFLSEAVRHNPAVFDHLAAGGKSPGVWKEILKHRGELYSAAPASIQEDQESIQNAVSSHPELYRDYDFDVDDSQRLAENAASLATTDVDFLKNLPSTLRETTSVQLAATRANGLSLQHIDGPYSRRLKTAALVSDGMALQYLSAEDRDDPRWVKMAIKENPDALQHASSRLRSDREFLLDVAKIDGNALVHASSSLRRNKGFIDEAWFFDPCVYNAASHSLRRQKGFTFDTVQRLGRWADKRALDIPPALLENEADLLRLLVYRPDLLKVAPSKFRRSKRFAEKMLAEAPLAYKYLSPTLKRDRDWNHRMLKNFGGGFYPDMDETLRDDKRLALLAFKDNPIAFEAASARIRRMPEVLDAVIAKNGLGFLFAGGTLAQDKDRLLEALKTAPDLVEYLDADWLQDADVMLAAIKGIPTNIRQADASLLENPGFLNRVARINPLAIEYLPKAMKSEFLKEHPAVKRSITALRRRLKRADIEFPERLGDLECMNAILDARLRPSGNDDRPTCIFVYPKSDSNGAFSLNELPEVSKHHRTLYFEAGSDADVKRILDGLVEDGEQADLFMFGGHGQQHVVAFGRTDPEREFEFTDGKAYVDLWDEGLLLSLTQIMKAESVFVLGSCSTGQGRGEHPNMANHISPGIPQSDFYAPIFPTMNRMRFSDDDKFLDPGFSEGRMITYFIPRSDVN